MMPMRKAIPNKPKEQEQVASVEIKFEIHWDFRLRLLLPQFVQASHAHKLRVQVIQAA